MISTRTLRETIKSVSARWAAAYPDDRYGKNKLNIGHRLNSLNLEVVTPDDIGRIIGNKSWTSLTCDACKKDVEAVVMVGEEPNYESSTASLCFDCVQIAVKRLEAVIQNDYQTGGPK